MLVQARHRTVEAMPWRLVEFIWRRVNQGNHWNALLDTLDTLANVEFDGLIGDVAPVEFIPNGRRVPAFIQHRCCSGGKMVVKIKEDDKEVR
ncbi:hypothetical protein [Absidia glauca]|uniref:Uncharacterized protein n=1 Tax=Absidia glauca TaxID=4829 RepID=A0A163IU84_ABSGL|nr:hypothetical protein [Absidia glauca]